MPQVQDLADSLAIAFDELKLLQPAAAVSPERQSGLGQVLQRGAKALATMGLPTPRAR
jgi:hypothetical protein